MPKKKDKSIITEEDLYDLADLFKAFSDTTRIKLLYALISDWKPNLKYPVALASGVNVFV